MEIQYKINQHGIITKDGVVVPMIEGTTAHNEYVQYLTDGGTVGETDVTTAADVELLEVILPTVVDLNGETAYLRR